MSARRDVKDAVVKAIQKGRVLKTYKVKAGVGRKSVTVGPCREAVPAKWHYAMIVGGELYDKYNDSATAATDFINYVGRDDAWNAVHDRGKERNPQ